ncbi:asparagine synthase-related protein, partial [Streptomyces sp. NPDC005568]|uniref:asparagine synthase-related protein n=1 Tax=Streptomyces sp. NPDC005568 TaxID=3156887 RepID=UPI0033AB13F0
TTWPPGWRARARSDGSGWPKGLFSAPLRAWMSRDLAPLVREVVHDGVLVNSGILRRDALARMVAEDAAGQRDFSKHLWHVLTLEHWYRGATSGSGRSTQHTA